MSISSKSNFTKSLYEEQYILVVRTIEVTWTEYAFGPFSPFDLWVSNIFRDLYIRFYLILFTTKGVGYCGECHNHFDYFV